MFFFFCKCVYAYLRGHITEQLRGFVQGFDHLAL